MYHRVLQALNRIAGVDRTCDFVKVSKTQNNKILFIANIESFCFFFFSLTFLTNVTGRFHEDAIS